MRCRHWGEQEAEVKLTPREISILRLLRGSKETGWRVPVNKEIAAQLGISTRTVAAYLNQLYSGLRLANRSELLAWCNQHPACRRGDWVEAYYHPPGCNCGMPYCLAVSD